MTTAELLFTNLAAAYVRGSLLSTDEAARQKELFNPALDMLEEDQLDELIELGRAHDLRLHRFKRTMGLPRVAKVLGMLRGILPSNLLDIGSGRGAFLWPLLAAQPYLPVTAIDTLDYRVADMQRVAQGGIARLQAQQADVTKLPFASASFDSVTMLEVLEHLPSPALALREVLRVAKRFVIISVPAHADNNPEHIHLFSAKQLNALLYEYGATRVSIEQVSGHLIALARVS